MYEAVERRQILITTGIMIALPLLMGLKEYPALTAAQHFPYLLGRGIFVAFSLVYFVMALLDRTPAHYPAAGYLMAVSYAVHGQFFQPNYWLAFIEINTLFPVFFFLNQRMLFSFYALSLTVFDIAFYITSSKYIQLGFFNEVVRNDILIGTIITTAVTLISYHSFTVIRLKKNLLLQRFIDVGKNFSFIMHDIKGMISTPSLYASMLEKSVDANTFSDNEKSLFHFLREDLTSIKDFVFQINKLVSAEFSDEDRRQFISLSESTDLIKALLKSKLKNIKVHQIGDMDINVKLESINRILINAMVNSIDAIVRNKIKEGEISVTCSNNTLTVADNSGTQLSAASLKTLNSSHATYTDKAGGSGLGTMIIKDYTKALGGRVLFSNCRTGVMLTVTFPKHLVKKSLGGPALPQTSTASNEDEPRKLVG